MFNPNETIEEYQEETYALPRRFRTMIITDAIEKANKKNTGRLIVFTCDIKSKDENENGRTMQIYCNYEHEHKKCESDGQIKLQQICVACGITQAFDPQHDLRIFLSKAFEADCEHLEDSDFPEFYSFRPRKALQSVPPTNTPANSDSSNQDGMFDDDISF